MAQIFIKRNLLLTFWSLGQVLCTAIIITFSKHLFSNGVDPLNFSVQVLFTSGVMIFIYMVIRKRKILSFPAPSKLAAIFLIAIFHGVLAFSLSFIGLKYSSATNFSFLIQTSLIFSSLLAYIFLREKMGVAKILLITLMMTGVYLLSTSGSLLIPSTGDLFIVGGTLCFSIGVIIAKVLLNEIHPLTLTMFRNFFSATALFLILFVLGKLQNNIDLLPIIFCGLLLSTAAYSMNKILRHSTVSFMNLMFMLTPVFTGILALVFLSEVLSNIQIIGAMIILSSGVLVSKIELGHS